MPSSYKWRCLTCGLFTPQVVLTAGQEPPVDAAEVYCSFCHKATVQRAYGAPERRHKPRQKNRQA